MKEITIDEEKVQERLKSDDLPYAIRMCSTFHIELQILFTCK